MSTRSVLLAPVLLVGMLTSHDRPLQAQEPANPEIVGRWDLTVHAKGGDHPSWLEVWTSGDTHLVGQFVGGGGSARPISRIDFANGTVHFSIPPQWEQGDSDLHVAGALTGDQLSGSLTDPAGKRYTWTAKRAPLLRRTSPPRWGAPVRLFNGTDLASWQTPGACTSLPTGQGCPRDTVRTTK